MKRRSTQEELVEIINHIILLYGGIKEMKDVSFRSHFENGKWIYYKYKVCEFNYATDTIRASFSQYNFDVTVRPERIIIKSKTKKYDISPIQLYAIQQQLRKIKQL